MTSQVNPKNLSTPYIVNKKYISGLTYFLSQKVWCFGRYVQTGNRSHACGVFSVPFAVLVEDVHFGRFELDGGMYLDNAAGPAHREAMQGSLDRVTLVTEALCCSRNYTHFL